MRKLAFEALAEKDTQEARRLFRCAIGTNPSDIVALKQLVYLDIDLNNKPLAIQDIERLRNLHAQNTQLEMQLGYLYSEANQLAQARRAFERAIEYNDPVVTEQARKALRVIAAEWPQRQFGFYLDSQYMSRFSDEVNDADFRFYERLGWRSPISFYLNGRILRDTESHTGTLPEIYSDNAALMGGGFVFQPYRAHYFISAEANEAYLFKENITGRSSLVPDFRTVGGYFRVWPAAPDARFHLEANGSMGFYSRYQKDGIAYLQPRQVLDLVHAGGMTFAGFVQESIALDTNQEFYNNTAEIIPGLDVHLRRNAAAALRFEAVRGYYLDLPTHSPNPYGPVYKDYRVRLILGRNLSLGTP